MIELFFMFVFDFCSNNIKCSRIDELNTYKHMLVLAYQYYF